jgi:hypothetical protein
MPFFQHSPRRLLVLLVVLATAAASSSTATPAAPQNNLATALWRQGRRWLNFSSLIGSPTAVSPYERITGHPVFAVTTPWGSPYMNMERLSDLNEVVQTPTGGAAGNRASPQSISEEQNEYRTVCLYFMDPDDATAVHGEMKQMDQMKSADLRLTTFSLAKALRQAANLGNGLVTGQPPDATNGALRVGEGAALRYKIVPPLRQLYYAARCHGKERVGLWGESPAVDAATALLGSGALEAENLVRRRQQRERKSGAPSRTRMQQQNAHMEGYTGIPVFFHPALQRKPPLLKRLLSGNKGEIPLFFNYEDLQAAYATVRERQVGSSSAVGPPPPAAMEEVEVFNLWDVLTSMDRAWSQQSPWEGWKKRVGLGASSSSGPGLTDVSFVPSSKSARYKESISARGNSKPRLRPMR